MKIGYACICIGDSRFRFKTVTQKYLSEEKLLSIIAHNIKALQNILIYNKEHKIYMFRISSDFVPFASSDLNVVKWQQIFKHELLEIGRFIKKNQMRVSMHPGQYTIINSIHDGVIARAISEIAYHNDVLDAMGLDLTHKIILHIGGIYQDKKASIARFIRVFKTMDKLVKKRIVIENDDRYYAVDDVMQIANCLTIPVVFDTLHHAILKPSSAERTVSEWLQLTHATWKESDGTQKIHYSEQAPNKRVGAHAKSIQINKFIKFCKDYEDIDKDIMLEVKDKNFAAKKAIYTYFFEEDGFYNEWQYYRMLFFLHDFSLYKYYQEAFLKKADINRLVFYQQCEELLWKNIDKSNGLALIEFILNEFNKGLNDMNRRRLEKMKSQYLEDLLSFSAFMGVVSRMAERLGNCSLYNSLLIF